MRSQTKQGRQHPPPCQPVCPSRSSQSSLLQTVPPSLAPQLQYPKSMGNVKIKKISYPSTPKFLWQNSPIPTPVSILLLISVILSLSGRQQSQVSDPVGAHASVSHRTQQGPLGLFPASPLLPWLYRKQSSYPGFPPPPGLSRLCSLYSNSGMLPFSRASCHLPLLYVCHAPRPVSHLLQATEAGEPYKYYPPMGAKTLTICFLQVHYPDTWFGGLPMYSCHLFCLYIQKEGKANRSYL